MAMQLNIGEAKSRLSEMVAASVRGEVVTIARAGVPAVRLVPEPSQLPDEAEKRTEIGRRRKAFRGKYKGHFADFDFTAPFMTDDEVVVWEEDQVRRFYSGGDESAA